MTIRTMKIILIGLAVAIIVFIILGIYPMFGDIREASQDFIMKKKEMAELEIITNSLLSAEKTELSSALLVPIEPSDFINFLEEENTFLGISNEVVSLEEEEEPIFVCKISGSPKGFLAFLTKIESADYLINITGFNIKREEQEGEIKVSSFSGKVYGKIF